MPALYLLEDFARLPAARIGSRAHQLGQLHAQRVQLLPTACIPGSTLELIGQANNLTQSLRSLLTDARFGDPIQQSKLTKQVVRLFVGLRIPHELSAQLLRLHTDYFHQASINVLGSDDRLTKLEAEHRCVNGEANVIESLLTFWGQATFEHLRYAGSQQPITKLLYDYPILLQLEPSIISSGVIYTLHPQTGAKSTYVVESRWGWEGPVKDTITLDARTLLPSERMVGVQTDHGVRTSAGVRKMPVPAILQSHASLPDSALSKLAENTQICKRAQLEHLRIHWLFDGQRVFIAAAEPFTPDFFDKPNEHGHTTVFKPTATKLYISAGNPARAQSFVTQLVDGVGVLRSEYTFAAFGAHPSHMLNSRARDQVGKQLLNAIQTFQSVLKGRPLTYRALNFHSGELGRLEFATAYEQPETNPYLGMRGVLRTQRYPTVFKLELSVLHQALASSPTPLRLLIPFARTPSELAYAVELVEKEGLYNYPHFEVWFQLNTPENLLNIQAYPLKKVAGLSIQVQTVNALLHGFDPDNPELAAQYPLQEQVLVPLIKKTVKVVSQPLYIDDTKHRKSVVVHLEQFSPSLVEQAIEAGVAGITVKPAVASMAKACIMETEARLIGRAPHSRG